MEGVAKQSCMEGPLTQAGKVGAWTRRAVSLTPRENTHECLWTVPVALRSGPGAAARWIRFSNPRLHMFCVSLNTGPLFQLEMSTAVAPLPHNVCVLLTFPPGMFSPPPCLTKARLFPQIQLKCPLLEGAHLPVLS